MKTQIISGYGGSKEGFAVKTPDGAVACGYLGNADFPGDVSRKDRGELFYVEVPKHLRRRGVGFLLAVQALELMKSHGCTTVNFSPTSNEGRALIAKLIEKKIVEGPIRQSKTGKMEFTLE